MINLQMLREHVFAFASEARGNWRALDSATQYALFAAIFFGLGLLGYSTLSPVGRPGLQNISHVGARTGSAVMERQSDNMIDATAVSIPEFAEQKAGISKNAVGPKLRADARKSKLHFSKASPSKPGHKVKFADHKGRANANFKSEQRVTSNAFEPDSVWSVSKMQ